ncbi:hypothetical protein MUN89_00960 [Halobacillus salinarum]|uniref:Uncharacterized protein n=1 Tax=Halobacillus salinarum TaxID=2932257 RepID=A0ABY4ELV7_9BACI|nr:hypothetical protein [Halobacillus salinarum]UOQ44582.1 hypothetical protein MUN89_00960 [Halobacillus salinarum]
MKRVKPAKHVYGEDLKKKIIHPPNEEDELFFSKLPIYPPYQIYEYKGNPLIMATGLIHASLEEMTTVEKLQSKAGVASHINPFSEENLLEDLANVNIKDEQTILDFCNKYGLFGFNIDTGGPKSLTSPPEEVEIKEKAFVNLYEELEGFKNHTRVLQELIRNFFIEIPKVQKEVRGKEDFKKINELNELRRGSSRLLNRGLKLVSPGLNFDNGKLLPSFTSTTMLGAAFYQLYEAITQEKQFRRCLHCNSLFIPRTPNAKFCPPLHFGKHSSCQNSYNQMKSRARKAVKEKGRTVEDVAQSIGRPAKEVRGWF